jgi:simple sugar transport system ATP-binding protein
MPSAGSVTGPAVVGFVPEDRHADAMLLDRTLVENVALRGAGGRRGTVSWSRLTAQATALVAAYDVRASDVRVPARTLSGGNQQRLVLGRELGLAEGEGDAALPDALVVENPTRGLDVRAAAEVRARLRAAREVGVAIVFHSSDLDEVLEMATRVVVVFDGTVREMPSLDREGVGRAMLGLA